MIKISGSIFLAVLILGCYENLDRNPNNLYEDQNMLISNPWSSNFYPQKIKRDGCDYFLFDISRRHVIYKRVNSDRESRRNCGKTFEMDHIDSRWLSKKDMRKIKRYLYIFGDHPKNSSKPRLRRY